MEKAKNHKIDPVKLKMLVFKKERRFSAANKLPRSFFKRRCEDLMIKKIKFCSKIQNYKLEAIVQDTYHRKTFISNNLPNPYFALHYFKKSQTSFEFYKVLEFVINNWEFCRGTFAPLDLQEWISMDLATAIALIISGLEDVAIDQVNPLEFIHMKSAIQGWDSIPSTWRNYANFVLNSKGEFLVGNIKQEKIFHVFHIYYVYL